MTTTLISLLLRLSEAGAGTPVSGSVVRRHFGPAFDRLLAGGVLEELTPADTWPVCPDCDCGLDARAIVKRAGVLSAVCPLDADADLHLHRDDCRMFAVHERRLVALIAGADAALPEPIPGLWQLGRKLVGYELFLALRRGVLGNPALPSVILRHAQDRAALLSPRLSSAQAIRLRAAGIALLPAGEVIIATDTGGAHLDDPMVVRLIRGGSARLEVRAAEKAVFVDGTHQHVPERPFGLLLELVEAACNGGRSVNARTYQRNTQRDAPDVLRNLKQALTKGRANAADIESWFAHRRTLGGYVLTLDPSLIDLLP